MANLTNRQQFSVVNTFIEHKDDVEVFKTQVRLAVSLQSFEHFDFISMVDNKPLYLVCLCGSRVVYPIIIRRVLSPSRFETRQWCSNCFSICSILWPIPWKSACLACRKRNVSWWARRLAWRRKAKKTEGDREWEISNILLAFDREIRGVIILWLVHW